MRPPTPLPSRPILIPSSSTPSQTDPSTSNSSASTSSAEYTSYLTTSNHSLPHSLLSRSYSASPLSSPPRPHSTYTPISSPLASSLRRSAPPSTARSPTQRTSPDPSGNTTPLESDTKGLKRRSTSSPLVGSWSSSLLSMRMPEPPLTLGPSFSARLRLPPLPATSNNRSRPRTRSPSTSAPTARSGSSPNLGGPGPRVARILTTPFNATFYTLATPYVSTITLPAPQQLPMKGSIQLLLLNPEEQPLRAFLVGFDARDMGVGERRYVRQMCYAPAPGEVGLGMGVAREGEGGEGKETAKGKGKGVLRYAVQFCISCTAPPAEEDSEEEDDEDVHADGEGHSPPSGSDGSPPLFEMDDPNPKHAHISTSPNSHFPPLLPSSLPATRSRRRRPSSPHLSPQRSTRRSSHLSPRPRRPSTTAPRPPKPTKQIWLAPTIRVVFASRTADEEGPLRVVTEVEGSGDWLLSSPSPSPVSPPGLGEGQKGILSQTAPRSPTFRSPETHISTNGHPTVPTAPATPPGLPLPTTGPGQTVKRPTPPRRPSSPFPLPLPSRAGPTLGLSTQTMHGVVVPPPTSPSAGLGAVGQGISRSSTPVPRLRGLGLPSLPNPQAAPGSQDEQRQPSSRTNGVAEDNDLQPLAHAFDEMSLTPSSLNHSISASPPPRERETEKDTEPVYGWDGRPSRQAMYAYGERRWADEAVIR